MRMSGRIAFVVAVSVLAVSAPVSAQFGGFGALKKKVESAVKELEKPKPQPTPPPTPPQSPPPATQGGYATPAQARSSISVSRPLQETSHASTAAEDVTQVTPQEPDQIWECNSGFPDAGGLVKLRLTNLKRHASNVEGTYEIVGIPNFSGNSNLLETGRVRFDTYDYQFTLVQNFEEHRKNDPYADPSFFLSSKFSVTYNHTELSGTVLTETPSKERKEALDTGEVDGFLQQCAQPGTWTSKMGGIK